jgi:DNA-binding response OmpR family regulator
MSVRILVIEDETALLDFYRTVLTEAGYQTRCIRSGEEALQAFRAFGPDLLILDLGLAGQLDGFDVLQALRQENAAARVLILTAQPGEARMVRGLEGGADDYVVKTVSGEHLLARVRAQLRRAPAGAAEVYRHGGVEVDLAVNQVRRQGKRMILGEAERRVLARLLQTPGQMVTFAELSEVGWALAFPKQHFEEDLRILKSCIYRLRLKLGTGIIESARDLGFYIVAPAAGAPPAAATPLRARGRLVRLVKKVGARRKK